ncbi:TPA: tail fiber protein, partial [Neisseria meningitidis]
MANLNETAQWETGIYQLETSDPVMGGPDGIDNRQAKQLANRTLWLKNQTEALQTESEGKVSLSGDQTIIGQKTFAAATQFQSGIHLSANPTHWNAGYKAYIGADNDNAHIVFGDDTLRLHSANNRISYN